MRSKWAGKTRHVERRRCARNAAIGTRNIADTMFEAEPLCGPHQRKTPQISQFSNNKLPFLRFASNHSKNLL